MQHLCFGYSFISVIMMECCSKKKKEQKRTKKRTKELVPQRNKHENEDCTKKRKQS